MVSYQYTVSVLILFSPLPFKNVVPLSLSLLDFTWINFLFHLTFVVFFVLFLLHFLLPGFACVSPLPCLASLSLHLFFHSPFHSSVIFSFFVFTSPFSACCSPYHSSSQMFFHSSTGNDVRLFICIIISIKGPWLRPEPHCAGCFTDIK